MLINAIKSPYDHAFQMILWLYMVLIIIRVDKEPVKNQSLAKQRPYFKSIIGSLRILQTLLHS